MKNKKTLVTAFILLSYIIMAVATTMLPLISYLPCNAVISLQGEFLQIENTDSFPYTDVNVSIENEGVYWRYFTDENGLNIPSGTTVLLPLNEFINDNNELLTPENRLWNAMLNFKESHDTYYEAKATIHY